MKKLFLSAFILFIPVYAMADRTVTISPKDSKVKISNPSSFFLNYHITCYNGTGAQHLSQPEGINQNETKIHNILPTSGGACAFTTEQTYNNGMARCYNPSTMNYAQASNACSSGYRVCSLQEWNDNQGAHSTQDGAFLDIGSMTSFSFFDGSSWNDYSTTVRWPVTSGATSERISTGPGGTGTVYNKVFHYSASMMGNLTMCCPNGNNMNGVGAGGDVMCKITVNGNNGHLVCPDFKGGTPF